MGLDYSIELYFRIEDLETALNETVKIASFDPQKIDVTIPSGRTIQLPFTSHFKYDPVEIKQGERTEFDIALWFPAELDIREYSPDEPITIDSREYLAIGYIYLSIRPTARFVTFSFMAATTDMSLLFLNSKTIQKRFIDLLNSSNGVYGQINLENEAPRMLSDPKREAWEDDNHPFGPDKS